MLTKKGSTDMIIPIPVIPFWIHIKQIPVLIILFGFLSKSYRYICLAPYQTDTNNRCKLILTDYLQVLPSISANFTDTDIRHSDTDTDYPFWIHIKPIPK